MIFLSRPCLHEYETLECLYNFVGGPINSQSKYEKGEKSDVSDETNQTAMYMYV